MVVRRKQLQTPAAHVHAERLEGSGLLPNSALISPSPTGPARTTPRRPCTVIASATPRSSPSTAPCTTSPSPPTWPCWRPSPTSRQRSCATCPVSPGPLTSRRLGPAGVRRRPRSASGRARRWASSAPHRTCGRPWAGSRTASTSSSPTAAAGCWPGWPADPRSARSSARRYPRWHDPPGPPATWSPGPAWTGSAAPRSGPRPWWSASWSPTPCCTRAPTSRSRWPGAGPGCGWRSVTPTAGRRCLSASTPREVDRARDAAGRRGVRGLGRAAHPGRRQGRLGGAPGRCPRGPPPDARPAPAGRVHHPTPSGPGLTRKSHRCNVLMT